MSDLSASEYSSMLISSNLAPVSFTMMFKRTVVMFSVTYLESRSSGSMLKVCSV